MQLFLSKCAFYPYITLTKHYVGGRSQSRLINTVAKPYMGGCH